jgi:hypothetical protein
MAANSCTEARQAFGSDGAIFEGTIKRGLSIDQVFTRGNRLDFMAS